MKILNTIVLGLAIFLTSGWLFATPYPGGGVHPIAVSDIATGIDGELITWDASGDPATVAVGTSTEVLTSNGAGAAPTFQAAAGGGDLTLVGSDDTDGTTVSTTFVDLATVGSLTISTNTGIMIVASIRKTSGASANATVSLKINGSGVGNNLVWSETNNANQSGLFKFWIFPHDATYLRGAFMQSASGAGVQQTNIGSDLPNAEITEIIVIGKVSSGSITMGVQYLKVYTLAGS